MDTELVVLDARISNDLKVEDELSVDRNRCLDSIQTRLIIWKGYIATLSTRPLLF